MLTADKILAIPLDRPELLFPDISAITARYRELVRLWHPDTHHDPKATEVMQHVVHLHKAATTKAKAGVWAPEGWVEFLGRDGKRRRLQYRKRHTFEMGEMYVGVGYVTFVIDKAHENLMIKGLGQIGSITFPTPSWSSKLGPRLPKVEKTFETDTKWVVAIQKMPDAVVLSDLLRHMGGQLPPVHTAWVLSDLLDLACFLELTGTTVNGLHPGSVLVSPSKHSVGLYGGWWYAAKSGAQISSLPPETHRIAPRSMLISKIASPALDMASIKAIGRACLGDEQGATLRLRKDIPEPMAEWLMAPVKSSAIAEYGRWPKVLDASFGPRRFHKLDVSLSDVYPEGT